MSSGDSSRQMGTAWIVLAALLLAPAAARAHRYGLRNLSAANELAIALQGQDTDREEARTEQDETKQEREQEAREREEEKREREEEARERVQEKAERLQELYDDGREALDDDRYDQAAAKFKELAALNGPQTDAALYWKAYAENHQGKKDSAQATLADLKTRFPQSRWTKDAAALELEVKQSTGRPASPESQGDEELKLLALQGIMNNDPERAIPILEKRLNGTGSPREKSKALFVIAQSGSPQAQEILEKVARGQSNPDLQRKAVEYLGMFGGEKSKKTLGEVYASSKDEAVKRAVLRSYMMSGDRLGLFTAAKNERDESLKREAIRQLGLTGGHSELQQLYQSESSTEIRREILQGFFLGGDSQKLVQVAQSEKDAELRRTAIRNLGLMGGGESSKALQEIYAKETDRSLKEEVLNAYFLQGNAGALVAIARLEKDPGLKKRAVEKLSLMGSKEANDYLMELLQK
jgi:hypothetical protein